MIANYVRVAARNILKRKLYSSINAFGLSIAVAFCMLIYFFIQDERSFDTFHQNLGSLYRLDAIRYNEGNSYKGESSAYVQAALAPLLKEEVTQVKYATRFIERQGSITYNDKIFNEKLTFADRDFLSMFSFPWLAGNHNNPFSLKTDVVITRHMAEKYFGLENPIGKALQINTGAEEITFIVQGVVDNPPANSSLDFDILLPADNLPGIENDLEQWGAQSYPTFVQLQEGTDPSSFKIRLDYLVEKYMGAFLKDWKAGRNAPAHQKIFEIGVTPFKKIHFKKEVSWHKTSDAKYSWILGGIALLILIIACINYIALALTASTGRKIEVGIRKAAGANKKQIVYQFTIESILMAFISMLLGLGLMRLFLPSFNDFTGKEISLQQMDWLYLSGFLLLLVFTVGVLAGGYPAFYLSRFSPSQVLKGNFATRLQFGFTRPLVVLQFALSGFLIFSSVIMLRQMEFITSKDLGYDQHQLIVIPLTKKPGEDTYNIVQRLRTSLLTYPSIVSVSGAGMSFTRNSMAFGYGEGKSAFFYFVDEEYIKTLGIQLAQGRDFDVDIASDTADAVIVNEALVKDNGWEDPLNEYINWNGGSGGKGSRIIGVVKDYHFLSLEQDVSPVILTMSFRRSGLKNLLVKVSPDNLPGSVQAIKNVWGDIAGDKPFEYHFLDQDVANQYQSYERWVDIMKVSTVFAIIIASLGLFGLAGINSENRTKEIGIRKVLGADLINIFVLLNKQYVLLTLIAFVFAMPFSLLAMNKWLMSFKYSIPLSWEIFVLSMVIGIVITLATVSYHALKASLINPARTLKHE